MNLTKSLKWAMVCAGVTAFSASAQSGAPWVEESFDFGVSFGSPIINQLDWTASGGNDASVIADAEAAGRLGFNACETPLGLPDAFVLELNTEGDTLIRDFSALNVDFGTDPVYVDMMVKFVLSEDYPDAPEGAVKTMLFANADSNLVVYSNDMSDNDFTELNAPIDPEQWYRLTLTWEFDGIWSWSFFRIELNGEAIIGPEGIGWDRDTGSAGPWFMTAGLQDDTSLSSIEFQGTGFIDDLVVTDLEPDFGEDTLFAGVGQKVNPTLYLNWLTANLLGTIENNTATLGMWSAYLLNVAPGDGTTDAKLVIEAIEPMADLPILGGPGAIVTLGAVDGTGAVAPFDSPNGILELWRTDSLEVPFTLFKSISNAGTQAVWEIEGDTDKYFYRAVIK